MVLNDGTDAKNYCRNPNGKFTRHPSCIVRDKNKKLEYQACEIDNILFERTNIQSSTPSLSKTPAGAFKETQGTAIGSWNKTS